MNKEAAADYQRDEYGTNSCGRLGGQVNLPTSSVICTCPFHFAAGRVSRQSIAFDATKRDDENHESPGVVSEDVKDKLQNRLKYQLSDDAPRHSAFYFRGLTQR